MMKKIGLVLMLLLLAVSTCQAKTVRVRNIITRQLTVQETREIAEYLAYWECKAPKEDFTGMDQGMALLMLTGRIHHHDLREKRIIWKPQVIWAMIQEAEAGYEVEIPDQPVPVVPRPKISCRLVEPSSWSFDREQLVSVGTIFRISRKAKHFRPRPVPPPRPTPVPLPCPPLPVVINPPAPHLGD